MSVTRLPSNGYHGPLSDPQFGPDIRLKSLLKNGDWLP